MHLLKLLDCKRGSSLYKAIRLPALLLCSPAALVVNSSLQGLAVSTWIPVSLPALFCFRESYEKWQVWKMSSITVIVLEFHHFYFLVCITISNLLLAKFVSSCAWDTQISQKYVYIAWIDSSRAIPQPITQKWGKLWHFLNFLKIMCTCWTWNNCHAMPWLRRLATSHWPFTAEAWVRLQATMLEVDCGRSGSGIGPPQSTSAFAFTTVSIHQCPILALHSSITDLI